MEPNNFVEEIQKRGFNLPDEKVGELLTIIKQKGKSSKQFKDFGQQNIEPQLQKTFLDLLNEFFPPQANQSDMVDTIVKGAAGTLGALGGTATAVGGGMTLAGFTSSGIAAGSIAAGVQSGIGTVAAGSTFATLQSLGAIGAFTTLGVIGIAGIAVGGLGYGGYKLYQHFKNKDQKEDKKEDKKDNDDQPSMQS